MPADREVGPYENDNAFAGGRGLCALLTAADRAVQIAAINWLLGASGQHTLDLSHPDIGNL